MNPNPGPIAVIINGVGFVSDLLGGIAAAIALFVFITKRNEVATAFRLLINYSYQTTLHELRDKLERLNEYSASEPTDVPEIQNILHELSGQIRGNKRLHKVAPELADKIEKLASGKKLTEPRKRALVSEIREVLRHLNVENFQNLIGKDE